MHECNFLYIILYSVKKIKNTEIRKKCLILRTNFNSFYDEFISQ